MAQNMVIDKKKKEKKEKKVRKRSAPYPRPKSKSWRGYAARFYTDEAVAEREAAHTLTALPDLINHPTGADDRKTELVKEFYTPPPPAIPIPTPPPVLIGEVQTISFKGEEEEDVGTLDDLTLDINTACIGCGQNQLDAQCDCLSFVDRLDEIVGRTV